MRRFLQIGRIGTGIVLALTVFMVSSASADRLTSPNYILNSNAGGSFGGQLSSSSYKMTSIGGETVIGSGGSSSYIMDQQQDSSSPSSSMQLSVQPSGLVAYYPMDENTGTTTADASQYQHDGTLSTNVTATWNANGKIGSAVQMNGTAAGTWQGTGGVHVPDNPNLPSGSVMTVEAWLKQDAQPTGNSDRAIADQWYISNTDSTQDSASWAFGTKAGALTASIASSLTDSGGTYVSTAAGVFSYGTWQHVVMVYDGSLQPADRVKFYVNGNFVSSTVSGNPVAPSLQNSTADFIIGAWSDIYEVMNGSIDHVKLFNRALSASEVAAEYAAQNAGNPAGLTLGTLTSGSTTSLQDVIVRSSASAYNISVQQDHDLQSGATTIPAVSGSIASPAAWSEGVTRGLGFTLIGAPSLDSKWGSGGSYAAFPGVATTFYSTSSHTSGQVDVINTRLRLDVSATQPAGAYGNTITYTGTTTP